MVNSKLKQFNLSFLRQQSKLGGGGNDDRLVSLSLAKGDKYDKAAGRMRVRISFHRRLLEKTGWKPGTILDMAFDDGKVLMQTAKFGVALAGREDSRRCHVKFAAPAEYAALFDGTASEIEAAVNQCAFVVVPATPQEQPEP